MLLAAYVTAPLAAQRSSQFTDIIPELVARIASVLPAGAQVSLTVVATDDAGVRQPAVAALLAGRGLRIVTAADGIASISLGCGENLRERACVAEIRADGKNVVVTATRPHDNGPQDDRGASLALVLRPVFSQRAQILDVAIISGRLLVLDSASITLYEQSNGGWRTVQSTPISTSQVWPRDLRGRLRADGERVDVFLPGVTCAGRVNPLDVACADRRQSWPFDIENGGLEAARNYFTTPEGLAFYGAAQLGADTEGRWVLADREGMLSMLDGARRPIANLGSGDDVVALRGPCGSDTYLASAWRAPNTEDRDALRLSRLVGLRLVQAASPVILPGTLTALWTTSDPTAITVVAHDVNAGRYDAFQASISCGR